VDPDGKVCVSYYDKNKGKYGILTYSPTDSKLINISCSILDFYPLGIGEAGKRLAEFLGSDFSNNLKIIDASTTKGYKLNETMRVILDKYGKVDNTIYITSKLTNALYKGSKGAKILGKINSFSGNISNYVINPTLLALSLTDYDSGIIDNFIVGIFWKNMYSSTREGVENKYKFMQTEILKSLENGDLILIYHEDKNWIEYSTKNANWINDLSKKLDEME
jgi:hypothetical protein